MVVGEDERRWDAFEQAAKPLLPLPQRLTSPIAAVKEEEIEDEIDETRREMRVGCRLKLGKGGDAVRAHGAELAIEVKPTRLERRHGLGRRLVARGPVEAGPRQQLHPTVLEPRMEAIAVELDFMRPT